MLENVKIIWWKKETPQFLNKGWVSKVKTTFDFESGEKPVWLVKITRFPIQERGQWVYEHEIGWRVAKPNEF